jgi:hypothetical protein
MRRFVKGHPAYTGNSILSKEVMDDLLIQLHKISIGAIEDENFKSIFPHAKLKDPVCSYIKASKKKVFLNHYC